MKPLTLFLLIVVSMSSIQAFSTVQPGSEATDHAATLQAVQNTLDAQVAAWNKGDIPGFMAGYVNSETLRFASGDTVTTGWATTLKRYQTRYTDRKIMGTLTFKDITITPLSNEFAEVFGRFHLARDLEAGDATGLFTLLMKKTDKGWLVWHDHTSSASE